MKERAKTARRSANGTNIECWLFDEHSPGKRCRWPTSALARRLSDACDDMYVAAVLEAYAWILDHPMGTEDMVRRLRDLRRAERNEGFNDA